MEIGYGISSNGLHEDGKEIKMSGFEEGELVEMVSKTGLGEEDSALVSKIEESQETRAGADENLVNEDSGSKNQNRGRKKVLNIRDIRDMSRFVTMVCKHLRIRKSYLVWNAVACLGVSAICDLVDEADAIQECNGRRSRVIFWNIIKMREPNAYEEIMERGLEFEMGHYKEIMKRGRELEKQQLKQVPKTPLTNQEAKDVISHNTPPGTMTDQPLANALDDGSSLPSNMVCDS